jgi:hypothetical protein
MSDLVKVSYSPENPYNNAVSSLDENDEPRATGRIANKFVRASGLFQDLHKIVLHKAWSPILFKDNYRLRRNFDSADLLALDFDSGEWTLEDAKKWVIENDFAAMIATTKSHQKVKGNGFICDRFRIIIRSSAPVYDSESYEYTMKTLINSVPADKSCKDAARFFYPCASMFLQTNGENRFNWLTCPIEESASVKSTVNAEKALNDWRDVHKISPVIWGHIMWGCKPPGRHKLCYIIGANLGMRGFGSNEIIRLLKENNSPLMAIGEQDALRAIINGINRGIDEFKSDESLYAKYNEKRLRSKEEAR